MKQNKNDSLERLNKVIDNMETLQKYMLRRLDNDLLKLRALRIKAEIELKENGKS